MARPALVLIAGFPGYQLFERYKFLGLVSVQRHLWTDIEELAFRGGWGRLQLDTEGEGPLPGSTTEIEPRSPHPQYYWPLRNFFWSKKWDVISPQLDWRKKLEHIGPALSEYLLSLKDRWPLRILCHSGGGLFLRFALKWLAQAEPDVAKVIYKVAGLACAHWGSFQSLTATQGFVGNAWFYDLSKSNFSHRGDKTQEEYVRDVAQSFPCLFQLFPRPHPRVSDEVTLSRIYDPQWWRDAQRPVPEKWLNYAKAEWDADIPTEWQGPPWLSIISKGIKTPVGIKDWSKLGTLEGFDWTINGDNTIPTHLQTMDGMTNYEVVGLNHNQVTHNRSVLQVAYNHLF